MIHIVHKLIKREITEFIEPKDEEDVKKILGQTDKKKEEEETDIMDDYDEGMGEFLESMGGKTVEPMKKKPSEIRALGD